MPGKKSQFSLEVEHTADLASLFEDGSSESIVCSGYLRLNLTSMLSLFVLKGSCGLREAAPVEKMAG